LEAQKHFRDSEELDWENWVFAHSHGYVSSLWNAARSFGRRPYWARLWIIQELAVAKTAVVLCGDACLSYAALMVLHDLIVHAFDSERAKEALGEYPEAEMSHLSNMLLPADAEAKIRVEEVFSWFSDFLCSDPRDRLYGLLRLIEWPANMPALIPNYAQSAFELALRLKDCMYFFTIGDMLKALSMDCRTEQVQQLINERRISTTDQLEDEEYGYQAFGPPSEACSYLKLELDKTGNLTTGLKEISSAAIHSQETITNSKELIARALVR